MSNKLSRNFIIFMRITDWDNLRSMWSDRRERSGELEWTEAGQTSSILKVEK